MPIIGEDEREAIRGVVDLDLPCEVGVTVRTHEADLRAAVECGVRHVYMFFSVSPLHLRCKFGMESLDQAMDVALRHVDLARQMGLTPTFIAEDSTGAEPEGLVRLFTRLHGVGVVRAIICDTAVRVPSPIAFYQFCRYILTECPTTLEFAVHCHNDLGDANANTVLAVSAGVTIPTVTVNGIGERAGNAPLEQTVMTLEKMGVRTGIKLDALYELSRLVQRASGIPMPPHAPVVGLNAFRHESGIHAAGVLTDPRTYETILPEEVGRTREIIFGKHSGRHQVEALLVEHGLPHEFALVDAVLREIKAMKAADSHRPLVEMLDHLDAYYRAHFGVPVSMILAKARELADDHVTTNAA
jgi:isopropylmalate/homocitrate/citramalate synthase